MSDPEHLVSLNREALLALVAELQRQLMEQQRQIAELTERNAALQAALERLTRGAKRQATPFSKGTRVAKPKRPGRKPGRGLFCYREVPLATQFTEPPVDVPVTLESCPDCGGSLTEERVDFAYTTDLPSMPRPRVTQYRVSVCRCTSCGKQVRGQHPAVAPDQYGATAHRVGERVMAAAHGLHYGVGLPVRKVPVVLEALTGVTVTQGAITQDAMRRAQDVIGDVYEQLRAAVPEHPIVHTDDTGWRVGGEAAYLMAFETDAATVYQIRTQHRHKEVQEVIPPDYAGVMVTDRGRSYDAQAFAGVKQQKCLAHILRSIHDILHSKTGRARDFGERLKALLQEAIQRWQTYHAGAVADFNADAQRLRDALTHHLRNRCLTDPDNQRLLNQIGRHHDRDDLLRFLEDPRIEPTNNRAERVLRPAVIARKVSQCSKNASGAYAHAAFTSVIRTLVKHNGVRALVAGLYDIFQSVSIHAAPV
jgi:transposase